MKNFKKIDNISRTSISILSPFKLLVLRNFPFIEADYDALTNYELMCLMNKYMNDINSNVNILNKNQEGLYDAFNNVVNYINDYFDNLDIQEEVNNKLDDMAEDGSLENIINKVLNATNGTLVCSIDYRDCTEFIDGVTNESTPIKGYIQGFTTTPTSYIIARQTGGNFEDKSNMIYLEEISKSTKETLKSAYLELFHANSLAYNDTTKEIYVATNSYRDENFELLPKNEIIIVDYNTFTITDTITPPSEITSNNRVRSVSYDNKNNVLALADTTDIWIMTDFETIENHITLNTNYTAPYTNPVNNYITNQNTVVYDNKIYSTRFWANGLSVYDMNGNLIRNYYDFDIDIAFQIGELESITIEDNGDIYLASTQLATSNNNVCKLYDITIVKSNLKYNGYKNYYYSSVLSNRIAYYVDSDTTNKIQCGTQALPFKSIQQAIIATQYNFKNVSCSINLIGTNKQYGFIVCKNNISLIVNGNNNKIYSMQIQNQNIELINLIVNNDILVNVGTINNPSNIQITDQSNVIFNNVKILNNSSEKLTNSVFVIFSTLKLFDGEIKNFTNAFRLLNYSTLYMRGTIINNCDYYWYNEANCTINHGDSPAVIERQNPNSQDLVYYKTYQRIPFTFENNLLTFNKPKYDNNKLICLGIRFTLGTVVSVHNTIIKTGANNVFSFETITSNNIFHIYGAFNHVTQGQWRIESIHVIREAISDGTLTDVTNDATINLRDVMVL